MMRETKIVQAASDRLHGSTLLAVVALAAAFTCCKPGPFQEDPALLLRAGVNQKIQTLNQALDGESDPYARGVARGRLAMALWNKGDRNAAFLAAGKALQEHPLAPDALAVYSFGLQRAGQSQAAGIYTEICSRADLICAQPQDFRPDITVLAGESSEAVIRALASLLDGVPEKTATELAPDAIVFEGTLLQDNGVRILSYAVREGALLRGEGIVEFVTDSNREAALKAIVSDVESFVGERQRIELSSASGFLRGTLSGCLEPALEIVAEQSAVYVQRKTCQLSGEVAGGGVAFEVAELSQGQFLAPGSQTLSEAETLISSQKYEQALALLESAGGASEPGAEALLRGGGVIQTYLGDSVRASQWYQRALERTRNADLHAEALIGLARAAPDDIVKKRILGLVLTHLRGTTAFEAARRELQ